MFGLERYITVPSLVRGLNFVLTGLKNSIDKNEKNIELLKTTVPVGTPQLWLMDEAPEGWLLATGQAVSRIQYADLFKVYGIKFGSGDGSTTFNLPNPSGLVPRFVGTQAINGRDKVGPAQTGDKQEDQTQLITGVLNLRGGNNTENGRPNNTTSTATGAFTKGTTATGQAMGATAATFTVVNEIKFNTSTSPNARTSSTTSGETRVSSFGFGLIIKY